MKWLVVVLLAACADERIRSEPCTGDCSVRIHPDGILDPDSAAFHGRELARHAWDFATCRRCHGEDDAGGSAGVSCLGCHRDGPTACTTCHGAGPNSRAHPAHAARGVPCAACHPVPARWDDDGHLVHAGAAVTAVRVELGALAARTPAGAERAGPPRWDGVRCENVYCHGDVGGAGGTATRPAWDGPALACTGCHASPPPSHARTDCATCHPATAPHVDGIVQVGRTAGCDGCHGSPASPAPPVDLAGNTATTALGVGAHQAHLQARSRLSAPIPCATCHAVPAAVVAPGHLDHAGPAQVTATLGWDRDAQTCASAWCHGPARPRWTATGEVSCGSCHGVPPADGAHAPGLPITACAGCHPGTVDAFGNILVREGSSEHINGVVDHR